jgi:hypothetical protein
VRQKINELILICVSSIVHMALLHFLTPKAKLISVTRMDTKHANVNTIKIRHGWVGCLLLSSLRVKGWLWVWRVWNLFGF